MAKEEQVAGEMEQLNIIVTGFGSFQGVPANPTEVLVQWLHEHYSVHSSSKSVAIEPAGDVQPLQSLPGAARIYSAHVLRVSAQAVDSFLAHQIQAVAADSCLGPGPLLLLHFGVDTHRNWFNLECQAVNTATFRCPDEDGWQPQEQPIQLINHDSSTGGSSGDAMPLTAAWTCSLDLLALQQHLAAKGHAVRLSEDAGRFVCNFIYYKSLMASRAIKGRRCHSLFVHCPSFAAVAPAAQKAFIADLLEALATALAPVPLMSTTTASNGDAALDTMRTLT